MSSSVLILLDYIEKAIVKMNVEIRERNLRRTNVEFEKLMAFSDCLKSLLPEEFAKTTFGDFDRHMHFIGYYIEKRDFDWIKSNFDDLAKNDFSNIKQKIYSFLEKAKLPERKVAPLSKNIFIVHGRDTKPVKELKAMLSELGLKPIFLHEQPSGSRTIVEKLEKYSDVGYAFVVLTPDDVTLSSDDFLRKLQSDEEFRISEETFWSMITKRARQNVVLEFGYFMGLLGRDRVCCLYKGDIELPSDMHGIVYVPFKESINECRDKIIKELKAAGYEIKT